MTSTDAAADGAGPAPEPGRPAGPDTPGQTVADTGGGDVPDLPGRAAPDVHGRSVPTGDDRPGPAVEVHGLTVRFGPVEAIRGIDLEVEAGGSLALVGRNGAGKSSTLRVLAGVLAPSSGQVRVSGLDPRRDPLAVKHRTGYCPDVGGLVPRATPWEHLQLAARLRGLLDWEDRARLLLERFDLAQAADRVTAGFSHGMGRRLSVVLAAFHRPQVLLLDEPFDGVDPLGVDATLELVADLRAAGSAVLVSTHLIDLAVRSCTEIAVLSGGRVAARAPASALSGPDGAERYRELLA